MRQFVVGFAFDELDAAVCESGYMVENHASAAVSRKAGYVDNGRRVLVQQTHEGKVSVEEQRVVVTPQTYRRPAALVSVAGADALRRFFGIER